ncbi:MAG TPA: hypothetical protein VHT94_07340 [Streptosporangiaceae bacterium]|nr:hypothetical protein [Streptosporangiaceae bacterium]
MSDRELSRYLASVAGGHSPGAVWAAAWGLADTMAPDRESRELLISVLVAGSYAVRPRDPDDLTLLALAGRVRRHLGHIEDMTPGERAYLLGLFMGAASRLHAFVSGLVADSETTNTYAVPSLRRVLTELGAEQE